MRWVLGILLVLIALLVSITLWVQPAPDPAGTTRERVAPAETTLPGEAAPEDAPGLSGNATRDPTADKSVGGTDEAFVDAGGIQVIGRAVDPTRRPVAGATIVAMVEGQPTGKVVSGSDGSFSISVGDVGRHARSGSLSLRTASLAAERQIWVGVDSPSPIDYGAIVLIKARTLEVRVTKDGVPEPGADVALGPREPQRGATRLQVADAEGCTRFTGLSATKVAVYAVAEGSGRTHKELVLEDKPSVEIALAPDRVVTVKVVRAGSEEPVPGAEIIVWGELTVPPPHGAGVLPPLGDIRTDETGTAQISGMHAGWLTFIVRAPGLAMKNEGTRVERASLKPGASEITVTLHPYRTVRFPVAEDSPKPADGTELSVRRYQPIPGYDVGEVRGVMADGHVVLENFPPGFDWGHVESPEGLWAEWKTPPDKDLGEPVMFRQIHDVRVKLSWPDGSPAVGEVLQGRIQPRGRTGDIASDEQGTVVFERCVGTSCHVRWAVGARGYGLSLGTVPLQTDPGVVEYTLQPKVSFEVAVRLEGEVMLPPAYELGVEDRGPPARPGSSRRIATQSIEEDPERGLLRFSWPGKADGSLPAVFLSAPGYAEVSALPVLGEGGVARVQLELAGSTALKLVVLRPEDGRYWHQLERWNEEEGDWFAPMNDSGYRTGSRGVEGVHRYKGLSPGRYRVREFNTNLLSPPFELVADGSELEIELDVRGAQVVSGRVTVPAGERAEFATVRVEGRERGRASVSNPVRVKEDGSFELRALEGQKLSLIAEHPLLEMAAPKVHVVGDPVPTLALRAGVQVSFRVTGLDETTTANAPNVSPAYTSPIRVRMASSSAWSAEMRPNYAIAKKGVFRAAGRGNAGVPWTIQIIQQQRVPLLLKDVEVSGGVTDLGMLTMSEGATLTARLLKGKKALPQWLAVVATPVGSKTQVASSYQVEETDPPEIRVRGLGAGRFTITVKRMMTNEAPLLETEVECDGTSPIVIDIKLP